MSPIVKDDFSKISSSFEPLEPATYHFRVQEVIDQSDDSEWLGKNPGKNPAMIVVSEVVDGERANSQFHDYIYLKTNEGKPSKGGRGKLKAYFEAICGKDQANSTTGLNTDEILQGDFTGIIQKNSYTKDGEQKENAKLVKILPYNG